MHVRVSSSQSGGEQAREAIKFGGLNAGGPDLRVIVAEEDVAVVELDGAHEWALPEVWSGESVVGFGSIVWSSEYAVVLEAAGSAADLGGVEEVAVALGDGDGGGVAVPTQEQKRVVAIARHQWVRHFLATQFRFSQNPHQ